ncbi:DUF5054 domain-containing protein [Devosia sp. XK-2]|uniref:DUF5054 domain-containing protein n=1 Tax=Devosia sp. XK-2 TaxID=3126689 RepID=UPI0030CE506B
MAGQHIHLVFKTHLDIGFTDLAAKVRQQYHHQFIPQAIATGEHFFAEHPRKPQFIWTTGAWLIWDHLNSQGAEQVRRLEQAIERGLITWHALPFTTHTELMSPATFRAGLSYAQELDQRFGRKTIAAKMTDVPGHTLGMVPLLAGAGIRFLHLGVNTASPVPDVPPIFRWQAPGGEEVVVMYQGSYGATDFPAGDDIGLSFAHTNDNIGPQSVGQTVEAIRHLGREHPGATIAASTLDAFGGEMWARRDKLPVVTQEIGDSWIHGAGSDPHKLARLRALQRLYDGFDTIDEKRRAFGRGLAMVAEHTWGVDIKTYLRDETAWDRPDFEAARRADYRFAYTEQSWAEQRAYLDDALANLSPADRNLAARDLNAFAVPAAAAPIQGTRLQDNGWSADLDPATGDLLNLTGPHGRSATGQNNSLIGYRHESYDSAELQKHLDSYLLHRAEWAVLDHDKPGLARAGTARSTTFAPRLLGIADANRAILAMPNPATSELGAPPRCEYSLKGAGDTAELTLILRDKPANRMPEAGFLHLCPQALVATRLKKLGLWHDSANQVRRAGGQLQAIEALTLECATASLRVEPLDCALIGPAAAPFMPFQPDMPDWSSGARFNLYNNKWGTNFPMWWEGTIAFRFVLRLSAAA